MLEDELIDELQCRAAKNQLINDYFDQQTVAKTGSLNSQIQDKVGESIEQISKDKFSEFENQIRSRTTSEIDSANEKFKLEIHEFIRESVKPSVTQKLRAYIDQIDNWIDKKTDAMFAEAFADWLEREKDTKGASMKQMLEKLLLKQSENSNPTETEATETEATETEATETEATETEATETEATETEATETEATETEATETEATETEATETEATETEATETEAIANNGNSIIGAQGTESPKLAFEARNNRQDQEHLPPTSPEISTQKKTSPDPPH